MPALSIIIVNWNTGPLLHNCLQALEPDVHPDYEIIIIDNASADDSARAARQSFPRLRLIENRENLGFARANNQGMAEARGRYLLLLNPDTLVPPTALPALLDFMAQHQTAGACAPRLRLPDGAAQPYSFGQDPRPAYLLRRALAQKVLRRPLHDWQTTRTQRQDWVSGACLLLRRAAIAQVGGLDENIFLYFEDNDLCLRLRQAGWQVWYHPQVAITHIGGQSAQHNPAAAAAYRHSLRYFYRKHYGPAANLFLRLALSLYARLSPATRHLPPAT